MRLIDMRGGFLYQHRPDLIPHGRLTDEELALWAVYHDRRRGEDGSTAAPAANAKRRRRR